MTHKSRSSTEGALSCGRRIKCIWCVRLIRRKRLPDSHNSQWGFLSWLDFVCKTQKSLTIRTDLYSWCSTRMQMCTRTQIWSVESVVMLGNEPLSKWSLVTNSQSKLWGCMLMKCQNCHFISSNYRLACRPFNDHLLLCLQCIRESIKSHFGEERTRSCYPEPAETHHERILIQNLWFLVYLWKTGTHSGSFFSPANQRLSRTCVITTALHCSYFQIIPLLFLALSGLIHEFFFHYKSRMGKH